MNSLPENLTGWGLRSTAVKMKANFREFLKPGSGAQESLSRKPSSWLNIHKVTSARLTALSDVKLRTFRKTEVLYRLLRSAKLLLWRAAAQTLGHAIRSRHDFANLNGSAIRESSIIVQRPENLGRITPIGVPSETESK